MRTEQQRPVAPEPTAIDLDVEDASDFHNATSDTSSDDEEGPEERADEREIGALLHEGPTTGRSSIMTQQASGEEGSSGADDQTSSLPGHQRLAPSVEAAQLHSNQLQGVRKGPSRVPLRDVILQIVARRKAAACSCNETRPSPPSSAPNHTEGTASSGLFVFGAQSTAAIATDLPSNSSTTEAGGQEPQQFLCPSCNVDFRSKRGLANHLRRGVTNRCALLKASLINKEQNIPTPSDPKATKRNRGQRREGAEGHQGDRRGHSTSPMNTKKRHRAPDYSEGPPWAEHPSQAVTSLQMLNARPAPATRQTQQQPAEATPEAQLTHTQPNAACGHRNQPITRNRPLRIPRLPTDAYARLKNTLEDPAKATTANVSTGTWEKVETAIEGFIAALYDAVWFANKKPTAANQQSSRKPPSSNSIQQEPRKARVPPRLAQAQDNVKKALLALREEEKAQQGRQQSRQEELLKSHLMSAAGPDGKGFFVYKRFEDVLVPAMTAIYNASSRHRRVPAKWKESVTVLIPKGGDPSSVKNWRPINLQDCIYKLYAALWANRITDWAIQSGVASKSQKGFMPVNGCHEHLFLAQSILHSTRRSKRPLYMTYYDLKNAFGSIPHKLIDVPFEDLKNALYKYSYHLSKTDNTQHSSHHPHGVPFEDLKNAMQVFISSQ
ncbi:hypothetical protein EPH_0061080 [Eimeria praecox]|uniref:Reverse transcriptase domain-containing protein n=1 Tax=Eimeria praecox TaxID=51316 RepID=U6H2Y1_9EIME|nr:hypothetical protein EPH_0061080 [Eimeria praecox]